MKTTGTMTAATIAPVDIPRERSFVPVEEVLLTPAPTRLAIVAIGVVVEMDCSRGRLVIVDIVVGRGLGKEDVVGAEDGLDTEEATLPLPVF